MSGGYFDYTQFRIMNSRVVLCKYLENLEAGAYRPETLAKLRECEQTLRLAGNMLHRVDWFLSADEGEETFHERWAEDVELLKKGGEPE